MKSLTLTLAALLACVSSPLAHSESQGKLNITPVASVELSQYSGKWFEIARFPNSFQRGCTRTTAEYTLRSDGRIDVNNRCVILESNKDGSKKERDRSGHGVAWVSGKGTGSQLKVSFFPAWLRIGGHPLFGIGANYWVIDLGQNYEYSVVSEPSGKYMWVLSRTPQMSASVFSQILERAAAQGLNVNKLVREPGAVIE